VGPKEAIELGQNNLSILYSTAKSKIFFSPFIFTSQAKFGFFSPTADKTPTR